MVHLKTKAANTCVRYSSTQEIARVAMLLRIFLFFTLEQFSCEIRENRTTYTWHEDQSCSIVEN